MQLLNNYWSYNDEDLHFYVEAISLGAYLPENMNFLALQVTEIFDLNGKPRKG